MFSRPVLSCQIENLPKWSGESAPGSERELAATSRHGDDSAQSPQAQ